MARLGNGEVREGELVFAERHQRNGSGLVLPSRRTIWMIHILDKGEDLLLWYRKDQELRLITILLVFGSLAGGGVLLRRDCPFLALTLNEERRK